MDGHTFVRWIERILGVPLMLVVLADVFLTVLYARMGTGILGERLGRALWLAFRGASKLAPPRRRDRVLPYAARSSCSPCGGVGRAPDARRSIQKMVPDSASSPRLGFRL